LICLTVLLLPANKRITTRLYYGKIAKDNLLENIPEKRIIFVGGSNVSFGINSQMVKDSLDLNPINTAIHAGIGLEYMLQNISEYLQKDDLVIIIPEYGHFTEKTIYGGSEMLITFFEVDGCKTWDKLSVDQIKLILREVPLYCLKKINPTNYFGEFKENGIYGRLSFNEFGDAVKHYGLPNKPIKPMSKPHLKEDFNPASMEILNDFQNFAEEKGAKVYLSYPAFHSSTSRPSLAFIDYIDSLLISSNFNVISDPNNYIMSDSLFFNTYYHLNKPGVDIRTSNLILDLKKFYR
jgi:hypothetical protein